MAAVEFARQVKAQQGGPRASDRDDAVEVARAHLANMHGEIEPSFARAGFWGGDAGSYPPPATRSAPRHRLRWPRVDTARGLWVGRRNPSDERFTEGDHLPHEVVALVTGGGITVTTWQRSQATRSESGSLPPSAATPRR